METNQRKIVKRPRSFKDIIVIIIKALIVLCVVASFVAGFLLKTAGVDYVKELKNRRKYSTKVKAVVTDVSFEDKGNTVISYQTVSYEYNGQSYTTTIEYSTEAHADGTISVGVGSGGSVGIRTGHDDEDESELRQKYDDSVNEHWKELKETVGTETEIMINPDNPSVAAGITTDRVMDSLRKMTIIGLIPITLLVILIVVLLIIGKVSGESEKTFILVTAIMTVMAVSPIIGIIAIILLFILFSKKGNEEDNT